jgi:glycosyltransferase involved in cell wall biosynthesis
VKTIAICPVYNEAHHIFSVVKDTLNYVDQVLVVDDGSLDETVTQAQKAGAKVLSHPFNLGKGAACRTGFYAAIQEKADIVITIDGDGQHNPKEIPEFLKAFETSPSQSLILGDRMLNTDKMPWLRTCTNHVLSLLLSLLAGQRINDSQCGFRAIRSELLRKLDYQHNRYDAESEILIRAARLGFKIGSVPIQTIYGNEMSKIHPFWDTLRFCRFFLKYAFRTPVIKKDSAQRISLELCDNMKKTP